MARMLDMAVVAKFPGARLAFLVSREFLFCLRCLHVWSLALWSAASTEPQAQPLLLRCMPSHMLLASGDPTAFFITQLWLCFFRTECCMQNHSCSSVTTGWSSWGLPSLLCLQWNKGDQDYPWLELGSLYSLELPPGHVSNTGEMQGYWCNMFHQDCFLIFFVWRPTTALSLRTNLAREDAILAIQEDGHRTFESVFVCSKGLELSR